jgi:hypothetical protein
MTRWLALVPTFALMGSALADKPAAPSPIVRIIYQDEESNSLKFFDVTSKDNALSADKPADVAGFPKLDTAKQSLVQMKECKGRLVVGVRDTEDGAFGSGYVMLMTGAKYNDHGDHGHWSYKKKPQVVAKAIDKEQGNPAHVYLYDETFAIANDKKNGYTRLDPTEFNLTPGGEPVSGSGKFVPGGGGHITLATVANTVGYGAWIDGGGENKGRVDVSLFGDKPGIKYSFALPSGVIHGATQAGDKVFFAPADGVCWVTADRAASQSKEQVKVNHISLGQDGDKPKRTGAFATHGKLVLCVTGKDESSELVLMDAGTADVKPITVKLNGKTGNKPITPEIILAGGKTLLALVAHDHAEGADVKDVCDVINLDPNGDGKFDDAKVVQTIAIGRSAVKGHGGHHSIGFDADGKRAYILNPGDGTVQVIELRTLELKSSFKLPGKPGAMVVVGGEDTED